MNSEIALAGITLLNQLLQQAAKVSSRIQAGTLTAVDIESVLSERAAARVEQLAELSKAKSEGR
jgi:hypothetical protein